jgi:signal transduction histidine kinase
MTLSLRSALMGLVLIVVLVGLVPAAFLLDRRLVGALEQGVRDDMASAPVVLRDRFDNQAGARMMHAKEMASHGVLAAAMGDGNGEAAMTLAAEVAAAFPGEEPLLVDAEGRGLLGPPVPADLLDATRDGGMPVVVVNTPDGPATMAVAPVMTDEGWAGLAGVWVPMGSEEADRLSALTRSDVLLEAPDESLAGYTGRAEPAMGLFGLLAQQPLSEEVRQFELAGERYFVVSAGLPGGARASFVRSLSEELAVVPALRSAGATVLGISIVLALLAGGWFAGRLAQPVGALAGAAQRITTGDFDVRVEHSAVAEVDQVARAFEVMRDALAMRIEELGDANRELEEKQERLSILQAELVQRDRLSAASRLLAQLAHEVRNPVASVRNCLEILRRRVEGDAEASELADLAIDELLRMHELAERMLDLHRPGATEGECDAASVASDVAAVVRVGLGEREIDVDVRAPDRLDAEIPADALKQVLLNLVQNAQDALGDEGTIEVRVEPVGANARIDVLDSGPGISDDALPQVFDPFFTTKADVRGVGLGLFTAAGIVRGHGGRIAAANRSDGRGARFTVEVPLVDVDFQEATA